MRLAGLALVLLALLVPAAGAGANVGGFEGGDGDQFSGNCAAAFDWQCVPSQALTGAIDNGAADDGFSGSKEEDLDHWTIASGVSAPSKADIQGAWTNSYTSSDRTRNYLDVAFKRLASGGDTFLGYELNQSQATYVNSAGSTVVCRSTGDVLVSYDIGGSSANVRLYRWVADGGAAITCSKGAKGSFTGPFTLGSDQAEAALNDGRVVDNFLTTGSVGSKFDSGEFGEGAVDLRALADAVAPGAGTACEYFRGIQVTTRSSSSITSNLEDYLYGGAIAARACATDSPQPTVAPTITGPAESCTGSVALSGTGEPNTTLTLEDGNFVLPGALADVNSSGQWAVTLNGVPNGVHNYTAVAGAGVASPTIKVTVTATCKPKTTTTTGTGTGTTDELGTIAGAGPGGVAGNLGIGLFGPGTKCVLKKFKSYVRVPGAIRVAFVVNGKTYANVK